MNYVRPNTPQRPALRPFLQAISLSPLDQASELILPGRRRCVDCYLRDQDYEPPFPPFLGDPVGIGSGPFAIMTGVLLDLWLLNTDFNSIEQVSIPKAIANAPSFFDMVPPRDNEPTFGDTLSLIRTVSSTAH